MFPLFVQEYFTQASKVLYNATRQRAFFKDITILVPHTWPDDPSYQSASVDQTLYKSDIIITSANPSVRMRSVPQTRSYGGCGNQGIHIQLTTDFLFKSAYPPYSRSPGWHCIKNDILLERTMYCHIRFCYDIEHMR